MGCYWYFNIRINIISSDKEDFTFKCDILYARANNVVMKRSKDEFLKILEKHKGIIFKVVNVYCHDKKDQEDLVQEVIIQLWKNLEKYNEKYKWSTWIYRIALNVSISQYRRISARTKYETPMSESFVEISESDEAENESEENIKLLQQYIDQLNELNKALMILYLDGKSYGEIAGILDITPSNVSTKINRIKKKLKRQFKITE